MAIPEGHVAKAGKKVLGKKPGKDKNRGKGKALAENLTEKTRVLVIDLDPQGNLSFTYGADGSGGNSLDMLTGERTAGECVVHAPLGDIIPSSRLLSGADVSISDTGKEYRLKEALEAVAGEYDYIIVDTPPALGILTVNALTACDSAIIPAQADVYSLQGIEQLGETVGAVKKYCNPGLYMEGILLTRYSPRAVLSRDIVTLMERTAAGLDTKVFKTKIREAVSVREAQLLQQDIFAYAPKSNVAADYRAFLKELRC
ncbi:MAG: ParA family protein [Oscillospiraceae bacterium]|nr:ParA family protein [Oscillospiraceae bacterium]